MLKQATYRPRKSALAGRYSYCRGNPLKYTDPSGEVYSGEIASAFANGLANAFSAIDGAWDDTFRNINRYMQLADEALDDDWVLKPFTPGGSGGGGGTAPRKKTIPLKMRAFLATTEIEFDEPDSDIIAALGASLSESSKDGDESLFLNPSIQIGTSSLRYDKKTGQYYYMLDEPIVVRAKRYKTEGYSEDGTNSKLSTQVLTDEETHDFFQSRGDLLGGPAGVLTGVIGGVPLLSITGVAAFATGTMYALVGLLQSDANSSVYNAYINSKNTSGIVIETVTTYNRHGVTTVHHIYYNEYPDYPLVGNGVLF